MIHDASFESDGSERSDLTPFDRVAQRSLIFRTDRGFVCFVSSGYNLRCFNFVEKPRFTFRAKNKHTSFSANSLLLLSLSFLFAALAFQSLSWVEKKRRKNRKFIVALTVNLSRSDIFVRKNLNTLERIHKISRCFERLTPSLRQFLSCVLRVTKFLDGKERGRERKEGRKGERERERKKGTRSAQLVPVQRDFFPGSLLAGRELLWSVVLYKLGITCPSFFSKRFAVEPQEFLREIEKKTTRIGEEVKEKRREKKIKRKKLRVKSRWKRLTFPSTWN